MAIEYIYEGGRKILYANFEGITDQDKFLEAALEVANTVRQGDGQQYMLANFIDASVGAKVMASIKDEAKAILREMPITTAAIGINGLKQILVNGYIRFTGSKLRVFKTREEAMEYLRSAP